MKKIFVGYTRFSLVSEDSKAWLISQKEDYLKMLFSPERLQDRLFFIEKSLESLSLSQSLYSKFHFIFYSDLLPDEYKGSLLSICSHHDFVIPLEVKNNTEFNFLKFIAEWLVKEKENDLLLGLYSLDDDDFLSNDYFLYSEKYMKEHFKGFHISYGLGIKSFFHKQTFSGSMTNYLPKINIGILTICEFRGGKIYWPGGGSHPTLDKRAPVILDSREYLYFWTRHRNQDTNSVAQHTYNDKFLQFNDIDESILKERFPIVYQIHGKERKVCSSIAEGNDMFFFENRGHVKFRVNYDIDEGSEIKASRPLLSFRFTEVDNIIISKIDLTDIGISKSGNDDYGFYRYLTIDKLKGFTDIIVNMPEEIDSFNLKVFSRGNKFKINSIDVFKMKV